MSTTVRILAQHSERARRMRLRAAMARDRARKQAEAMRRLLSKPEGVQPPDCGHD